MENRNFAGDLQISKVNKWYPGDVHAVKDMDMEDVYKRQQESNPVITASKEEKAEVPEKQEEAVHNDSSLQIQDDAGNGDSDTMDTFADANDMMKSADLSGTAGECSDTGFVINTSPFADGTSSSGDGGSITAVSYTHLDVYKRQMLVSTTRALSTLSVSE